MKSGPDADLRGDYSRPAADYTVEQEWGSFTAEEHALFRRLYERQANLVSRYACPEWIQAIGELAYCVNDPRPRRRISRRCMRG